MNNRKVIGLIIILFGILIVAYPIYFKIYSNMEQRKLKNEFEENRENVFEIKRDLELEDSMELEDSIEYDAWPDTLIRIPKIGLEAMVVEMEISDRDVFASNPNYPPAHYRTTAFPGSNDNVGIAAHRTGPADYFRHIDKLEKGDNIFLDTEKGVHEYIVESVFIVDPSDNSVIKSTNYGALTLTSCERADGISNKKRIIVRAILKKDVDKIQE